MESEVAAAADALDAAAPALDGLAAVLTNLSSLLTIMTPHHGAIAAVLGGYSGSPTHKSDLAAAATAGFDSVTTAAGAFAAAASDPGDTASLADVRTRLNDFAPERAGVAASLGDVIADIDASPDTGGFGASLDGVTPVYAQLGSPPSQVRTLLWWFALFRS